MSYCNKTEQDYDFMKMKIQNITYSNITVGVSCQRRISPLTLDVQILNLTNKIKFSQLGSDGLSKIMPFCLQFPVTKLSPADRVALSKNEINHQTLQSFNTINGTHHRKGRNTNS